MTTRVQMIIQTLQAYLERKFTARELAKEFIVRYSDELAEKRLNPRYDTEEKLIAQLAAEIGGERTEMAKKQCPNVATRDKPGPPVYYWQRNPVPAISQILIPAKERPNVDWQSANRIAVENKDFHHYIDQVSIYNQTGRLVASAWNK